MTEKPASSSSVPVGEPEEAAVASILSSIEDPWRRAIDCARALSEAAERRARPTGASTCLAALGLHLALELTARFRLARSMRDPVWAVLRELRPDWLARACASGEAVWVDLAEQVDAAAARVIDEAGVARPIVLVLRRLSALQHAGVVKVPPYGVREAAFRSPGGLDLRAGRRCEMHARLSADVRHFRLDPHAAFADESVGRGST